MSPVDMICKYMCVCYSGIECGDCVMNVDQYRAVSKTELDMTDHHSDADRAPGDAAGQIARY